MKLLLDTHIWIWSVSESSRLTKEVAAELGDPSNEIWLSPISIWELTNLVRKRRLFLPSDLASWVREAFRQFAYEEAVINHEVAIQTAMVDLAHHDPADRILAATAVVYALTLVTADEQLLRSKSFPTLPNR